MAKEDFPRLLREWRTANGLTQKALAVRLKIQHTTIGKYEQGKGVPSVEIRDKLIRETGLNATDIPCGRHYIKIENRPFTEAALRGGTSWVRTALYSFQKVKF